MKVLFLHGWKSVVGGVKPTWLERAGCTVLNPPLDDDDFPAAVRAAQLVYDRDRPDVIVGSSRGGAVAMNLDSGSTPLVLLCPAWKNWGQARRVKQRTIVLHSRQDEVIPFADSELLVEASGLPATALWEVGADHRLADPEPLAAMLAACRQLLGVTDTERWTAAACGDFFDHLSGEYTAVIERCFPRYREMLWALLSYLPLGWTPARIVELGCGTGNLTVLLAQRFPTAELLAVDLSSDSLAVCRDRLKDHDGLQTVVADMAHLQLPPASCDLVISSIALHHLEHPAKRELLRRSSKWLRPAGIWALADQMAGATESLSAAHQRMWQELSRDAGGSPEEWGMWMRHQQEHDHHASLLDHARWLSEAGFEAIDCVWRYLLWTVLTARRNGG